MDGLLVLGSLKALVLLATASFLTIALRGRPARLRAVVLGIALFGSLLIPVVAPLLPSWSLPLPVDLPSFGIARAVQVPADLPTLRPPETAEVAISSRPTPDQPVEIGTATARFPGFDWRRWLVVLWVVGAAATLGHIAVGQWRVARALRLARPVTENLWRSLLADAVRRTGCRRRVRLLASAEIEVPATVGVLRPVILVPNHAHSWPRDRRHAVLLHELVHVVRFDWATRMAARLARAIYWFNPLAWWAVRRLDLEQELACDEEVLALGTRASSYACHLLGIARGALLGATPVTAGLEMARKTHLEERIMTILKSTANRRVRPIVLLPAAILVAAMVPTIAAVNLSNEPRPASPELKEIIAEMNRIEDRIEPHLEQLEKLEFDLQPKIEALKDIEIDIDQEAIEEIQAKMQPYIDRMEAIEIDMKPYEKQMEELEEQLQSLQIHVEDGTLEEVQRQIQHQYQEHMKAIEDIHFDMAPLIEQIEAIHAEMEPLHLELSAVHEQMEPVHEQLENLHIDMEPIHEQMEAVHEAMEPLTEELELLGDRFERAVGREIETVLRDHVGPVTAPGAPIDEAAQRIAEDSNIHVMDDDNLVRVDASRSEVREILTDLLGPHRIGTEEAFRSAVEAAADALSPLEISVD